MVNQENPAGYDPNRPESDSRGADVGQREAGKEGLVSEVKQLTESGTKGSALILSAALIWWITNLFPYNFSERNVGTPTSRLGELTQNAESASATCNEAFQEFAMMLYLRVTRSDGVNCFALEVLPRFRAKNIRAKNIHDKQSSALDDIVEISRTANWSQNIKNVELDLDELAKIPGCKAEIKQWHDEYLAKCIGNRKEVLDFVAELSKQGNLDFLGLKISNIHPKWHPLVLVGIMAGWAIWLGARRRRVFSLLDRHFASTAAKGEGAAHNSARLNPVFLTPPWWLWPTPRWKYSDGSDFSQLLAPASEYRRLRLSTFILAIIIATMFASAVEEQTRVSAIKRMTALAQALAELPHPTFALIENVSTDLFALSLIAFGSAAIFLWIAPAKRPLQSNASDAGASRREILQRGVIAAALVAMASMSIAGSIDPRGSRKYLGSVPQRMGLLRRPRFQRLKTVAVHSGPAGWYRNESVTGGDDRRAVSHFVKPEMYVERRTSEKGWRKAFTRLIGQRPEVKYKPPRIGGAGNIDVSRLRKLPDEELIKQERTLNPRYYSEGLEFVALEKWRSDDRKGAIQILKIGLSYAVNQPRLNIRLYDLYAGLVIRSGRNHMDEFNSFVNQITALRSSTSDMERTLVLSDRLKRWNEPNGKWRKRWEAPLRKWNGLDI